MSRYVTAADLRPDQPIRLALACDLFLGGNFTTAWLKRQIQLGHCESYDIAGRTLVSQSQVEALCAKLQIDPRGARLHAAMEAAVYFVRCNEFVKIGYATNVAHRFRTMQTASPYEMLLLGTMTGGQAREAELHSRFQHLHHRGEWFRLAPELIEFLRQEGVGVA